LDLLASGLEPYRPTIHTASSSACGQEALVRSWVEEAQGHLGRRFGAGSPAVPETVRSIARTLAAHSPKMGKRVPLNFYGTIEKAQSATGREGNWSGGVPPLA